MIKICSFHSLPIEEERIGEVLSIANSYPRNIGTVHGKVKCVVPEWKDVKAYKDRQISEEQFVERYRQLVKKRWSAIKNWMNSLSADDELYLCCWEREGFCHRFLVAKMLQKFRPDLEVRVT